MWSPGKGFSAGRSERHTQRTTPNMRWRMPLVVLIAGLAVINGGKLEGERYGSVPHLKPFPG
jgi:hypothetical protein